VLAGALGADGVEAGVLEVDDESEEDDVLAGVLEASLEELLPSLEPDFAGPLLP
jgi:hypothetical protein